LPTPTGRSLAAPTHYGAVLVAGGSAWSAAFLIYLIIYWPILSRPSLDGRPG
jgi:uncharacterized protein involved in response to NO